MMADVLILLMMCLGALAEATPQTSITNATELIEERLASSDYDSRLRPSADEDALQVYINIQVTDISSISEENMEYSMSLFLVQMWTDDRLVFTEFEQDVTLNYNLVDEIWIPDLFIRNLKTGLFHSITVPNLFVRVSPNGTVLFSQRLTITLTCIMRLERYPMDNQTCTIELGSYGYTTDDMVFLWSLDTAAVDLDDSVNLPEYTMTNVTSEVCVHDGVGQKPCLVASFHLTRRIKSYILSTYLPQFLIVLASWLSFWMDPRSAPARTSLSITTVLTMITAQSSGQAANLSGATTKAIDVWMVVCIVFVFGAFLEFSMVNTLVLQEEKRRTLDDHGSPGAKSDLDAKKVDSGVPGFFDRMRSQSPSHSVDRACRVVFPLSFLVFNSVYWPYYTIIAQ